MTLAVVVVVGLAAHVVTTVLVGKWLAGVARQEIRDGLAELRDMLPEPVRAMLGMTEDRERVDV